MGQRHQIFLKVKNPIHATNNYMSSDDKKKAKNIFGEDGFTVIALHHQWLYGRSAIVNIKNVLDYTNQQTINNYTNPFSEDYRMESLNGYISDVMALLQTQSNPLHPRGIGLEKMHFLNLECLDDDGKYSSRWDMRKDFAMGDNNDGITIIDTIEQKYCLMNIFSHTNNPSDDDYDTTYTGVYNLPPMIPVDATTYAKAYYPDSSDNEGNNVVCSMLKDYGILTMEEIKVIFPEKFKEKVA